MPGGKEVGTASVFVFGREGLGEIRLTEKSTDREGIADKTEL